MPGEALDDRWDWIETTPFGTAEPTYVRGLCRHLLIERVVVRSIVTGEALASLCRTCDAQLPLRGTVS